MIHPESNSYEERENTLALLKILALGSRELELGKFRDAEEVFASIDKSDFNEGGHPGPSPPARATGRPRLRRT